MATGASTIPYHAMPYHKFTTLVTIVTKRESVGMYIAWGGVRSRRHGYREGGGHRSESGQDKYSRGTSAVHACLLALSAGT